MKRGAWRMIIETLIHWHYGIKIKTALTIRIDSKPPNTCQNGKFGA